MSGDIPFRKRPSGLGRGLSSLLGEVAEEAPVSGAARGGIQMLAVSDLEPHPGQPRRHFDEEALAELAASIQARGLIQPIVVRSHGPRYQIVAGERRWRAAQKAQLHQVPVIVRDFDDVETLEVAIIEMVERLVQARPASLGAAGRIRGITPAALAAIMVHARRKAA